MDSWVNHAAASYAGGNGTASSPYKIQTPEQLALLAKQTKNSSLACQYFSLEKSLNISKYLWAGIGCDEGGSFKGNFNGNMNTICGMLGDDETDYHGLFGELANATIENLIIADSFIVGYPTAGILAGFVSSSTIRNCIIQNSTISGGYIETAGGLIGYCNGSTITNCYLTGCTVSGGEDGAYLGGLVGTCSSGVTIANCAVANTLLVYSVAPNSAKFGVVGSGTPTVSSSYFELYIRDCYLTPNIIKTIYGSSADFGNWMYNSNINRGYPIQKNFLTLGSSSTQTSAQVYNYLVSLGFSK